MCEEVKQALENLASSGMLKPSEVVNAARDINSPLHAHFEWDDGDAAEKWREEQARQLIRSITIEVNAGEPTIVRAYVSLPADRESGAGYRKFEDVMTSEFMRMQLAAEIESKIEQWQRRADILCAMVSFSGMRKVAKKLRG